MNLSSSSVRLRMDATDIEGGDGPSPANFSSMDPRMGSKSSGRPVSFESSVRSLKIVPFFIDCFPCHDTPAVIGVGFEDRNRFSRIFSTDFETHNSSFDIGSQA